VARHAALARDRAGEGLHVVEHLLLRPVGGALAHAGVPEDFFVLQLSVVLPGWTLRSRQRAFRELARETVLANLPAHLEARCLWLDEAAMHNFESAYETWLNARLRWSEEPEDAQRCRALNAWSAALVGWLLKLRQADDGADSVAPAEGAGAARDGGQGAP
jgi:hypothetical protein